MARAPVGAIVQYLLKLTAHPGGDETDAGLVRRFVSAHDEAAFAAILQRHGPMVLGVCRRGLHDAHEAEDAFQATFLVFTRKAASLRRPERLANWLYGVARRVAAKARAGAVRRRAREESLSDAPATAPAVSAEGRELRRVLDEAIDRLPDKYRAPVVLCYLEGKTYTEAARKLGWAEGTVSGRLSRARDLLRRRLGRSGASFSAGLLVPLSSETIRNELVKSLTEAVVRTAAGQGVAGVVSQRAAALAEGVLKEMFWTKMKLVLAGLFVLGVAGAVAVGYGMAPAPDDGKPAPPGRAAAKVVLKPSDVDDVASILHIYKISGKVQFNGPIKKVGLKLEFYKAGQLKRTVDAVGLIDISGIAEKADAARFSLQAADLDYLPLAGGEKNSYRLQLNLQLLAAGSGTLVSGGQRNVEDEGQLVARGDWVSAVGGSTDIPKDLFDFSHAGGSAAFPAEAGSPTEVPLFYLLANTNESVGADTPAKVLAKNAKADVLIVSLWAPK